MSMTTALTGLMAAQSDIATTAHNIANAGTNAFRRSRAEFSDDYYTAPTNAFRTVIGSGTHLSRVAVQFSQGNFVATGQTLDLAIQGAGFFAIAPMLDEQGAPAEIVFTRNGGYTLDSEGRVADTLGRQLLCYPVAQDGSVLQLTEDAMRPVEVPLAYGDMSRTTELDLNLRLPVGEDMLNSQDAVPPTNAFDPDDPTSYAFTTPVPVMDDFGQMIEGRAYFVRTRSPDATDLTTDYEMHLIVDGSEFTPTGPTGATITFDEAGDVTAASSALDFGLTGTTYTVNLTGSQLHNLPFAVSEASQNGFTQMGLSNLEVDTAGVIWANYGSQSRMALGRVALADFANPQGLRQVGNASFAEASGSGRPNFSAAGESGFGQLQSGMLERSNVDLTEELVNLIAAQRNYQANAKAMETSSSLMQTILNIRG